MRGTFYGRAYLLNLPGVEGAGVDLVVRAVGRRVLKVIVLRNRTQVDAFQGHTRDCSYASV